MASTSVHPAAVQKDWEEFQYWMLSCFEYLHNFSELEKVASIKAAHERKEAWEQAEAARIAEKRRAAEEREAMLIISSQEAIERAELQRLEALRAEEARVQAEKEEEARAEAARAEAAKLEAEQAEAARAEAERQEAMACVVSGSASSSDPRLTSVDKTLEKVQEEQEVIKQKLTQQEVSNANMQNMLAQILAKLSGPSTSQP